MMTNRKPKVRVPDDRAIAEAAAHLRRGNLVGVPTETVYGLAASALDEAAVARIFEAKGRPSSNPLIAHIAGINQLDSVVQLPLPAATQTQLDAIADLWPGPLTVVLPCNDRVPRSVTAGLDTIAVRVPAHPVMQKLLAECGFPIAAPSANVSNYVSPTTAQHVADGLSDSVEMVLDGGTCCVGLESTIVALGPKPRLLRPGAISLEELARRWGTEPEDLVGSNAGSPQTLLAPGMMPKHYSPRTPVILIREASDFDLEKKVGRIAFSPLQETAGYCQIDVLSDSGNLEEVAQGLFASLRRMDDMALDLIVIDQCPPHGIGRAIMDRIERAISR